MTEHQDLRELTAEIEPPNRGAGIEARARQETLTKPTGALGRLESLSLWICEVQGRCPPRQFEHPGVVVFAADHGIAEAAVSAYPTEVTAQMVANFLAGGAAVNVLARHVGATVQVVDIGVRVDVEGAETTWKVRQGSRRLDERDALTPAETRAAVRAGADVARRAIGNGADLLIPGDMGIASTTACAAVLSALLDRAPEDLVGRGTGIDDAGWDRKVAAVRAGVSRLDDRTDPFGVLTAVGGLDIAAIAGFLLAAARLKTPVLLDGVVSCTAAFVVARMTSTAVPWWQAGHRSTEPAQQAALAELGIRPLLDLGMRLGEGTGALVALPVLQMAAATLAEMATFTDAGVSDRGR
jgi:nicotinate-nucleotide--dimethylbenzimidazole phosphoribosyltransferase